MFDVFFDGAHASIAVLAVDVPGMSQSNFQSVLPLLGDGPHPNAAANLGSITWQGGVPSSDATSLFSTMIFSGDIPYPPDPPRPK